MKNSIIEALNWRYAVKKFDSSKKISEADLQIIKESIRLTPTAFGLQPFHVFVLEDAKLRQKLVPAANGQTQIADASHVIVFAACKEITHAQVDAYMKNVATTRDLQLDQTVGFGNHVKNALAPWTEKQIIEWGIHQTYIALGFLMHTVAELRIDATPMEGFKKEEFDEILGLSEKGLTTAVICPIGYRSTEDKNQFIAKVRKSEEDLFTVI